MHCTWAAEDRPTVTSAFIYLSPTCPGFNGRSLLLRTEGFTQCVRSWLECSPFYCTPCRHVTPNAPSSAGPDPSFDEELASTQPVCGGPFPHHMPMGVLSSTTGWLLASRLALDPPSPWIGRVSTSNASCSNFCTSRNADDLTVRKGMKRTTDYDDHGPSTRARHVT